MRRILTLILILVAFIYCPAAVSRAETQSQAIKTEGSISSYSDSDMPEVFFFPRQRARWDGSKVTMSEWYMLTDLQKEKFISEYTAELKKQYQGAIEVLGLDYLKALNLFSAYSNEKIQNEPSTKFIDLLVEGQNKQGGK